MEEVKLSPTVIIFGHILAPIEALPVFSVLPSFFITPSQTLHSIQGSFVFNVNPLAEVIKMLTFELCL